MTTQSELQSLIDNYNSEDPDKVLLIQLIKDCLLDNTWNNFSDEMKLKIFSFIKSFIKTTEQAQQWIEPGNEPLILDLFLLRGGLKSKDSTLEMDWSLESLKCLANVMLQMEKFRSMFVDSGAYKFILERLQSTDKITNTDVKFLYYRLIYLSTLKFNPVVEALFKSDIHILNKDAIDTNCSLNATFPKNFILIDWFKILFNMHYTATQTNPPKIDETTLSNFSKIIPDVINVLKEYPPIEMSSPGIDAIHVLMNFKPKEYQDLNLSNEIFDFLTNVTLKLIESTVSNTDMYTKLAPVVMFTSLLAQSNDSAKKLLQASILPESTDRKKPLGYGETFSSKFIGLLTQSTIQHLKDAVGDLLFVLSDENGDIMVSNIGYGNAAGYLVNHSIPFNIPDDEMKNHINPITGQLLENETLKELQSMTIEEKEREAEKLFVLFERMKKNPAINIVNPLELAQQQGKFENLPDSDNSESDDETLA